MFRKELLTILMFCFLSQMTMAQSFIQAQDDANLTHVFSQVDFNGGGAAFVDLDNDGDDDVYLVGGNAQDRIFTNDGTGVFTEITETAGIQITEEYYTTGAIYGDINNDGFEDIYVSTYFPIPRDNDFARNLLFVNNGDLTFTEIWGNGIVKDKSMTMASTFIDYDLDGDLDIYNANYVKEIKFTYDENGAINGFDHTCFNNLLFRNDGDGDFFEVTQSVLPFESGCALAVTATDYDNDGDLDILLGNDFGPFIQPNKFLRNDYSETGRFTEIGAEIGADQQMFSMGIAIGDYDNDLDLDYYVTNLGKNLFLELEDGQFTDNAAAAGIENEFSGHNSSLSVSWGTLFADIDNDMDLDLFVANGFVPAPAFVDNSTLDPDRLFINNGDKTFTEVDSTAGISNSLVSRGCAYSDIDMDGGIDILSIVFDKPGFGEEPISCLFKNAKENDNNWIKFKLEGTVSNRSAFGAKIYLYAGSEIRMAELNGGASFCSHNTSFMHFGLGIYESVDSVQIIWPGGQNIQTETNLQINSVNYIKESVSTSIKELNPSMATVFPNPTEGLFSIRLNDDQEIERVEVFDYRGQRVVTANSTSINLEDQSPGLYLLKIFTKDNSLIVKKITRL